MKNSFLFAFFLALFFANCTAKDLEKIRFTEVEVVFEPLICCSDSWTTDSRFEEFQLRGFDKIIFDSGIENVAIENNIPINPGDRFLIDLEISETPNCDIICDSVMGQHISITKVKKL